jgi:YegS/Rv2252/BmrU family lipid kinase
VRLDFNSRKIVFVVNPHSGNGKTGREWPRIRALAEEIIGPFEAHLTEAPGDAVSLTRGCLQRGADIVVCVGGDGTLNEVVNGFFDDGGPIHPGALLGFIPNGTGCDFARTFPSSSRVKSSLESIKKGSTRKIDLGRIHFQDHQGLPAVRYFHNIASFGLGGEVVERVNRTSKALGPFITFIWGTLLSLATYKTKGVTVRIDDAKAFTRDIFHVAVANGRYQGGGMLVAPDAVMDDGLFHVTVIGAMSLPLVLLRLPKLYNGKIKTIPQVIAATGKRVAISSGERVLFDIDGEQPGVLPVELEIVPQAIEMIALT